MGLGPVSGFKLASELEEGGLNMHWKLHILQNHQSNPLNIDVKRRGRPCWDGDTGRHVGCARVEFLCNISVIVVRIAIENLVGA